MTPARQGISKGSPRYQKSGVFVAGSLPMPDRARVLRSRIVRVLDAGNPDAPYHGGTPTFRGPWYHRPGSLPWWIARQLVGGRVTTAEFTAAVDDLIAAGEIIEVWLDTGDGRSTPHSLLRPGRSEALKHPVARARGRADVLEAEPWYAGLGEAK